LRIFCQRAKDRFCARKNRAVGFNQLDGGVKLLVWNFRELCGDARVLRRQIIHGNAGHLLPAADPERAEVAVAVENQQRFRRWCGDADVAFHVGTLIQLHDSVEPVSRWSARSTDATPLG